MPNTDLHDRHHQPLHPLSQLAYAGMLRYQGGVCPCCQAVDIETGQCERVGIEIRQYAHCLVCDAYWRELFDCIGYELVPPPAQGADVGWVWRTEPPPGP